MGENREFPPIGRGLWTETPSVAKLPSVTPHSNVAADKITAAGMATHLAMVWCQRHGEVPQEASQQDLALQVRKVLAASARAQVCGGGGARGQKGEKT